MFPFKTKEFNYLTDLTIEQLELQFKNHVKTKNYFSLERDGKLYGKVCINGAIIEFGQSFSRNSFSPVVVLNWIQRESYTEINGYYRVSLSVILTSLIIPLSGLYLTIESNEILPVLFLTSIWVLIYITFGRWLFYRDFKLMEKVIYDIIKIPLHNT